MSGVQGGRNSGSQHGRSNHEHERSSLSSAVSRQKGCPCRTASGACKTCGNQNAGTSTAAADKNHGCASRRRVQGAAAEARMVCNTWQIEGSDLLGKTCKHGRVCRERWARRCRLEVLSAHLRKAWICRAMRLAGLLASTGPSMRALGRFTNKQGNSCAPHSQH